MDRGDIYLTAPRAPDPRRRRAYVVVSRPEFIDSRYSSVVCVPVYTSYTGVPTEVPLDETVGLKRLSYARCDEVTSVERSRLHQLVGHVAAAKLLELNGALAIALAIDREDL